MRNPAKRQMQVHASRESERIRRIIKGDAEAFRSLVREYYPLTFDLAFKMLGDPQDAEEVVQDAFVKIHQALGSFRGEASLKTWILRIVMRLSLNRRRDRARSAWHRLGLNRGEGNVSREGSTAPLPTGDPDPEEQYISGETRRQVLDLVDQLPDPLRQVLILNSFEDLSYEEIARILDIPLGTVSSRIYSARKKLLRALEQRDLL